MLDDKNIMVIYLTSEFMWMNIILRLSHKFVSRYRDPKLQVSKKYLYLFNLRRSFAIWTV